LAIQRCNGPIPAAHIFQDSFAIHVVVPSPTDAKCRLADFRFRYRAWFEKLNGFQIVEPVATSLIRSVGSGLHLEADIRWRRLLQFVKDGRRCFIHGIERKTCHKAVNF
jgi:hypothetical protein